MYVLFFLVVIYASLLEPRCLLAVGRGNHKRARMGSPILYVSLYVYIHFVVISHVFWPSLVDSLDVTIWAACWHAANIRKWSSTIVYPLLSFHLSICLSHSVFLPFYFYCFIMFLSFLPSFFLYTYACRFFYRSARANWSIHGWLINQSIHECAFVWENALIGINLLLAKVSGQTCFPGSMHELRSRYIAALETGWLWHWHLQ